MRKFIERHRVGLAVAAGFAVLFVAAAIATVVSSLQMMRAGKLQAGIEIQKQRADAEQERANQVSNVITRLISSAPTHDRQHRP